MEKAIITAVLKLGVQGQTHSQEDAPKRPLIAALSFLRGAFVSPSYGAAELSKPTTYIPYPPHLGGVAPKDTPT